MDRGYVDFQRLYGFVLAGAFFVTRAKTNLQFNRLESRPVEPGTGVRSDQIIWLRNPSSIQHYPDKLRRIHYVDAATGNRLIFLTNNLTLPALTITRLYKGRWQVELFFKWIKQHLRLRTFYGRSENAVRCQIWSAICAYLLVAIFKKQNGIEKSMNEILQIVSVSIFEQTAAKEVFANQTQATDPAAQGDEIQKSFLFNCI